MYKDIDPLFQIVKPEKDFNPDKSAGVSAFTDKILNKILPYPFFGSQSDPFFPELVKDHLRSLFTGDPEGIFGKIQLFQLTFVFLRLQRLKTDNTNINLEDVNYEDQRRYC